METFEEFFFKNPDVPAKLKITAVAFFALAFVLTGASILTSLALTFVYLILHCGILYVIRHKTVTNCSEPDQFMDVDTDEEDLDDYDLIVPQGGFEKKFLKPRRHFADSTPTSVINLRPKWRDAFAVKPSPDERYKIGKAMYNSKFFPIKKHQELVMSGMEPSKAIGMNQSRHGNRLAGFPLSPEPQHVLGIDRWKLSRQPLRPTARNVPLGDGFGKYAKPSFQTTNVKLNVPQTSSPFHEQSPVGLWDSMSLSAIAGSPSGYISPITSPSKENDTLYV
ncbi:hypothetical protein HOLleu_37218 [Holothuria leucospilota]|uniref:Uncharacterized protein n=1 Tax=Holothuria leucospilota TaxID=206669 RepID=A0A9Q0YGS6_HOLLE|nr:hypothetical protein HOLleu_37218 [Holothuria leucospilota]